MLKRYIGVLTIFSCFILNFAYAKHGSNFIEEQLELQEKHLEIQYNLRTENISNLLKAKVNLINGNLALAKHFLNRIHEEDSKITPVKKRYLALISFIEGDNKKVIEILKAKDFSNHSNFIQTCMLKLFSYIALDDIQGFLSDNNRCQALTQEYSKNNQLWLLNLVDIKTERKPIITNKNSSNYYLTQGLEIARLWLKMALFSNKEKLIAYYIGTLPESAYHSKRIREIIAYAYYRLGNNEKALEFAEDLTSANAENIKGNIKLENKEYELAFGHFQLALKKKHNSKNAIERAIPLAWQLEQFKDGKELLIRHIDSEFFAKKALDIAFDIRLGDIKIANKKIQQLNRKFVKNRPYKLDLMNSYIATMLNENNEKHSFADNACKKFDGLNCWLKFQHTLWPSIKGTIGRDEKIFDDNDEFDLDKLKSVAEIESMDENIVVNQQDIEELDSKLVKLPYLQ